MAQSTGPSLHDVRVEHVGSLLRPAWLMEAFSQRQAGAISDEKLREAQDRAIREVIARQEAAGLPVITDGEYRRSMFMESATSSLAGLPAVPSNDNQRVRPGGRFEASTTDPQTGLTGRIGLRANLPLEEFRFAQQASSKPVKVAILGPDRLMRRHERGPVYASDDEYAADFVAAYREMVQQLVDAGCRYVQIDGPEYTAYVDPPSVDRMRARGEDPEQNLARSIAIDNAIIEGFPDVTFGLHICRGNRRSMYHREGSYDAIAERLFGSLNVDRFLLEYDTDRAGGFEPLRHVPKGRVAVLGLVTTKFPDLETADDLKRRIEDASRSLDVEQLAISPQCGFSSSIQGNLLGEDAQWKKIDVLQNTAAEIWG